MKKALLIMLAILLVFSVALVGCNNTTPPNGNEGGFNEGGTNEGGTNEGGTDEGGSNEGGSNEGSTNEGGSNEGSTNEGGTNEGGSDNDDPNGGNSGESGEDDEPVNRGEMTVSGPASIYANYPARDITVSFTEADYSSLIEYSTSDSRVFVENGKIYAKGSFSSATVVTVTATTPYHTDSFTVSVSTYNDNSSETKLQYYENTLIKEENKGGIIFIGDSYFDGYKVDRPPFWSDFYVDYKNEKAFLMGISSAQIDNLEIVSERIVYPMEPSEIVIHIGFNDVHHGNLTPTEIANRIIALVETFKEKLPEVKIYFMGVEPKKNGYTAGDDYYTTSTVRATELTALMEQYATTKNWFTYLDTMGIFVNENGTVNTSAYVAKDLSHPTLAAYDKIREVLNTARGVVSYTPTATDDIFINNKGSSSDINGTGKNLMNSQGNPLVGNYTISGTLRYHDGKSSNAHIQFRFSGNDRFLLWDSDNDGAFGIGYISNGKTVKDTTAGTKTLKLAELKSIEWRIEVKDGVAKLYVNGELIHTITPSAIEYFNIGALQVDVSFVNIKLEVEEPPKVDEPLEADPGKGTMTFTYPATIYTNYAPKDITVSFSESKYESEVTFAVSDSRIKIENGKIYATGRVSGTEEVFVTATTPHDKVVFSVKITEFNINNDEATVLYYEENIIKPENKGGTIFIGDSYFSGQLKNGKPSFWSDFYEDFSGEKAFLMGISSSQIVNWEMVAERIVYPMEPSEIIVHIGFNDVHSSDRGVADISSRIIALLEEFHDRLPNTKIYYCSIEPKKNALDSGSQYYEKSMVHAPEINAILKDYAEKNAHVTFVDTRSLFFNSDGSINKNLYLSTDLSHPTLEAYDKYRQAINQARGKEVSLTPTEMIAANQAAVNTAAAAAKKNSTVYTIENNPKNYSGQTLAKYFTDASGNALTTYYSISGYMEISDL